MRLEVVAVGPERTAAIAVGELAAFLGQGERVVFERLPADRRLDWLAGRVALKAAYQRFDGSASYRDTVIGHLESGAPCVVGRDELYCSLAHSYGAGVGAVAESPVGVDIERSRSRSERVLHHIVGSAEVSYLRTLANGRDVSTLAWVVKEAVLKGLGTGLTIPPRRLRIASYAGGIVHIDIRHPAVADRSWVATAWSDGPFELAIAIPRESKIELHDAWHQPSRV